MLMIGDLKKKNESASKCMFLSIGKALSVLTSNDIHGEWRCGMPVLKLSRLTPLPPYE